MKIRFPALTGLLAVLLCAASAASTLSPAEMIRKSHAADRTVSYKGIKTITANTGKPVQAKVRILHQKPDKTRAEYLSPKELAGIVTIDKGSDSWRRLPSKGIWDHQKWGLPEENLTLALQNYKVVGAGTGTVAGRRAYIVKLLPKHSGIPSQTLWLDKYTYLVLKSEVRSPSGSLNSSSAFTSIQFRPTDLKDELFEPRGGIVDPPKVNGLGFTLMFPAYLPSGYLRVGITPMKIEGGISAHLQYTNGINTISIFERPITTGKNSKEHVVTKPNGVTIVSGSKGKISSAVIGDIAVKELVKVFKSLK